MIAVLRTPFRRLVLAILLSVLLHSSVMWLPGMRMPHYEAVLPPLTARLEPLPQRTHAAQGESKPARQSRRVATPRPRVEPASPLPQSAAAPVRALAEAEPMAAAREEAEREPAAGALPVPAGADAQEYWAKPVLPKHAQLDFAVYQGGGASFMIGEVHHALDMTDGRYVLKSETRTVGLANLFKRYLLAQTSRGIAGSTGLQPEFYEEEKTASGSTQKLNATFDWTAQALHFSQSGGAELPDGAQDILSMLYQLSQLPLDREIVPLSIGNGKKLEYYEFEIGAQEEISTPMGKLRALHLRKLHSQGEEGLEIWLGLEYRMLPVKITHIDRAGEVGGEVLVTAIRVSDE